MVCSSSDTLFLNLRTSAGVPGGGGDAFGRGEMPFSRANCSHFGGACFLTGDRSVLRGGVFSSGLRGMAPSEWRRMDRLTLRAFGTSRCSWMAPKGVRPSFVGGLRVSFWYSGTAPSVARRLFFFLAFLGPRPIILSIMDAISSRRRALVAGRSLRRGGGARCGGRVAARRLGQRAGGFTARGAARGAELAVSALNVRDTRGATLRARSSAAPTAGAVSAAGVRQRLQIARGYRKNRARCDRDVG